MRPCWLLCVMGALLPMSARADLECASALMPFEKYSPPARFACISKMIASGEIRKATEDQLKLTVTEAMVSLILSGDSEDVEVVKLTADELLRRDPDDRGSREAAYDALLAAGRIANLDDPGVKPSDVTGLPWKTRVPKEGIARPHEATYWQFDPTTEQLRETSVDLSQGPRVIVYFGLTCDFSRVAAKEALAHPDLRDIFLKHSLWVAVPESSHSVSLYKQWLLLNPRIPIGVLTSRQKWPRRRVAAVPYFFVIRDGHLVGEELGWRPGTAEKLIELLRK